MNRSLQKVVLFDFDMTLIDSSYGITECTDLLAAAKGLRRITRDDMLKVIGLPLAESWIALWGRYEEEWLDYYRSNFRELEQSLVREFPGTREVPIALRKQGAKLGVVSNRRYASAGVKASGLDDLFDVVVGLEDVENPKPAPDPIYCALDKLGVDRDDAQTAVYYVGDTDIDMQTSTAAGVTGIGVATGGYSEAVLRQAGAVHTCADLREILNIAL